jgi:hypothetical protein
MITRFCGGARGFPAVFHTIGGAGDDEVVVI